MTIDPFTLEIVQEGLLSVVREMRTNLIRTAYSSVIYEGHDFSCALMNGRGQLIAQGEDNPSHIFPLRWSVRLMLERFEGDIRPGDIFIHNDPYTGGTHLNDVAILFPLFSHGVLVAFPAMRAHWGDVGGMTPGSLSGKATEVYQEGVRIPMMKLYEEGKVNEALLALLMANVRQAEEREGDLRAMIGACRIAQERLEALAQRLGHETIVASVDQLLARADERMRQRISRLPEGSYPYEFYLESTGTSAEPVRIQVALTVGEDNLHVDFEGTSPQVSGPMNSGPAVAPSAVFAVVKSFLDPKGPVNDGVITPVSIHSPPGSVVNATFPAPCGGFAEVRRACESAVVGALAQVIPDEVTGDMKGTANHCYISGWDSQRGRPFLLYEYPAGGTGASRVNDGNNVCRTFMEGDFNTVQPVEGIELAYPLRVERCELRPDSGGDGERRGGLGLRREFRLLAEGGLLSVLSDKNVIPPFGVLGGWSGACNAFTVTRGGTEIQPSPVPGKVSAFPLQRDDVVVVQTSGGGGYGDPLAREPARVLADVEQGYITAERARTRYGLITSEGERAGVAEPPIHLMVGQREGLAEEGSRRLAAIHPATARSLGFAVGDVLEVVNPRGAPLRCWAALTREAPEGWLLVSPAALRALQVGHGAGTPLPVRLLSPSGAGAQGLPC